MAKQSRAMFLAGAVVAIGVFTGAGAQAAVQSKTIEYEHAGTKLKGLLVWDDASDGQRPGILVAHEWWGLNDYIRNRARQLARQGCLVFALDMYGDGKVTEHPREAGEWATAVRQNQATWRGLAQAGLEVLQQQSLWDREHLAAIGYCFGGSTVLQLAYGGADLDAVITFHAALPPPSEEDANRIKARLLICHGAQDSFIPEQAAQSFRQALDQADVDYEMIYYGGARHGFTVPGADQRGLEGLRYDEQADRRSWQAMQRLLFRELSFPGGPRRAS